MKNDDDPFEIPLACRLRGMPIDRSARPGCPQRVGQQDEEGPLLGQADPPRS